MAAGVQWWVDFSDAPAPADAIVVLAGQAYARPLYAAELYRQGLATQVWLSRPAVEPADELVRGLGVSLPKEEDLVREVLLKKGVPSARIHLYGRGVLSTADEARSFASALPEASRRRLLVVTSRYHARRAKMIFRRGLPGSEVRVVATPYEPQPRWWWRDKVLSEMATLEVAKTVYYLLGGRFLSAS